MSIDAAKFETPANELGAVPGGPSITRRTAGGAVFSTAQTIVGKLIGIGSQIILARLLKPEDFGLAGLALMAAVFAGQLRDPGINNILLRRQRHFQRWANAAFWMSMTTGIAAGALLIAAIPIMKWAYRAPAIAPLLVILAVGSPLISLSVVPAARVQAEMRFRLLSILGVCSAVFTAVVSIVLALLHFGAASLIIPAIAGAGIRAVILWIAGPFDLQFNPQFRRWRYLFEDMGWLFLATMLLCLVGQGDYMILGLRQTKQVVGYYFFAFSLATQISLLTASVAQVLQPALCQLMADRRQQMRAFVRAAKLLAVMCAVFCSLQVALAGPIIRLIFTSRSEPDKWYPAIPVLQALSVGSSVYAIGGLGAVFLYAQGAFRDLAALAAFYAAAFLTCVAIQAPNGAVAVAEAVAVVSIIMGWIILYVPIRRGGGNWRDVASCGLWPQILGALAVLPASLVGWRLPETRIGDATRLAAVSAVALAIYLPLVRATMPDTWVEGLALSKTFLRRLGVI